MEIPHEVQPIFRLVSMGGGLDSIGIQLVAVAAVAAGVHILRQWHRRRGEEELGRRPPRDEAGQDEALLAEGPQTPTYAYGDLAAQDSDEMLASAGEEAAPIAEPLTPERPGTPTSAPTPADIAQQQEEQQQPSGIALFSDFLGDEGPSSSHSSMSLPRSSAGMASPFLSYVPSELQKEEERAAHAAHAAASSAQHDLAQHDSATASSPEHYPLETRDTAPDPWAEIPRASLASNMDRSSTLRSAASDRRLPRVEEEDDVGMKSPLSPDAPSGSDGDAEESTPRVSTDEGVRLALKLDVIAGPCSETSFISADDVAAVTVGRAPDNDLVLHDAEVSGRHASISWSAAGRCWQVEDLGSLNGTLLNGEPIGIAALGGGGGVSGRPRGENYRLSTDDILQLGTATKLKVSVFPREMLPHNSGERHLSLSLSSFPRSLTMPKHRVPSFTSLLSPKINSSPSKQAVVAAASDELRLECCIASATGRDHARKGQIIEDVASAECPLRGSEIALDGTPAGLFCVFDGHCGRAAADAASGALPNEISSRLASCRESMLSRHPDGARDALHTSFLATDERIACEEGCTATALLAWYAGDGEVVMQTANVGDSAAILIDPTTGTFEVLTEDHRLTNPAERDRLVRTGIPLSDTSRRLYGLNLARALGDRFLKDEDLGLSAEPAVSKVATIARDKGALVLVASDGLWDVLDFFKVAAMAVAADSETDGGAVDVAAAVVTAAKKAGTRDDVTVLVVRVWPENEWALRSPTKNLDDGRFAAFEV